MRKASLLIVVIVAMIGVYYYWPEPAGVMDPANLVASPTPVLQEPVEGGTLYEVVASESIGRYLVQEQLAGMALPNDAVGETNNIAGRIGFDTSGNVVEGSEIWVNLGSLHSDESRRDNFVRANILHTQEFPAAVFVPHGIEGLPTPFPTSGTAEITITGDLTIRDITQSVVWHGTATFEDEHLLVSAKVAFPFSHFNLTQPRVAIVLSVADEIRLEADMRLARVS